MPRRSFYLPGTTATARRYRCAPAGSAAAGAAAGAWPAAGVGAVTVDRPVPARVEASSKPTTSARTRRRAAAPTDLERSQPVNTRIRYLSWSYRRRPAGSRPASHRCVRIPRPRRAGRRATTRTRRCGVRSYGGQIATPYWQRLRSSPISGSRSSARSAKRQAPGMLRIRPELSASPTGPLDAGLVGPHWLIDKEARACQPPVRVPGA